MNTKCKGYIICPGLDISSNATKTPIHDLWWRDCIDSLFVFSLDPAIPHLNFQTNNKALQYVLVSTLIMFRNIIHPGRLPILVSWGTVNNSASEGGPSSTSDSYNVSRLLFSTIWSKFRMVSLTSGAFLRRACNSPCETW